jgi:hypothetical protein
MRPAMAGRRCGGGGHYKGGRYWADQVKRSTLAKGMPALYLLETFRQFSSLAGRQGALGRNVTLRVCVFG